MSQRNVPARNRAQGWYRRRLIAIVLGIFGSLFASPTFASAGNLDGPLIRVVNYDRAAYGPGSDVSVFVTLQNTTGKTFTGSVTLSMSSLGRPLEDLAPQSVSPLRNQASTTLVFHPHPPKTNYRGYLLSISAFDQHHVLLDSAGGAVDVSSDWLKFPRYGYVTQFTAGTDAHAIVQALTTYHINGLQFYDVNYQHHRPYSPDNSWQNLENARVDRHVVLQLINDAHEHGMMAMDYNLWNGAYPDYQTDGSGARLDWGQFSSACAPRCTTANQAGYWGFPASWVARGLLEMNPNDAGWQELLFHGPQGEAQLFQHLPYDGWHIDTLGDSAIQYDAGGHPFYLGNFLASFANSAKSAIGNRRVLLNNVSRWNAAAVASSANVDFLYTELWNETSNYADLNATTKEARTYVSKPIVFPAYMNTDYAAKHRNCASCTFDEASVRLVDDTMLAAGGIHLEMGDMNKMLSNIFWPGPMLRMSPQLQEADLDIANFAVAYENILRYGVTDAPNRVEVSGAPTSTNGSSGSVWILPKQKAGFQILHLINLTANTSTAWRDENASYKAPSPLHDLKVKFYYAGAIAPVSSPLMVASPDYDHGKAIPLSFTSKSDASGNYIELTLPRLLYWDLIYLETTQLSGQDYHINPLVSLQAATYNNSSMGGIGILDSQDSTLGEMVGNACCGRWVEYDDVDFGAGVNTVELRVATALGGPVELHIDSPAGALIASGAIANTNGWQTWKTYSLKVGQARGLHNLYLVFPGAAINFNNFRFLP